MKTFFIRAILTITESMPRTRRTIYSYHSPVFVVILKVICDPIRYVTMIIMINNEIFSTILPPFFFGVRAIASSCLGLSDECL